MGAWRAAIAALGVAVAPLAWGQSTVAVFGKLDLGIRHIRYSGNGSANSVGTSGGWPSLLGVTGEEPLGGGLKASFWLEGALFPDTGESASNAFGLPFWNRGSWVAISSDKAGAVRVGRDWTPTYWGQWKLDPTYHLGVGNHLHLSRVDSFFLWRNNAVQYLTPTLGGFSARVMASAGEGGAEGSFGGGLLEYVDKRLFAMASYGRTRHAALGNFELANAGASYDFGVVRAMLLHARGKIGGFGERRTYLSGIMPLSQRTAAWASYGHVSTNRAGQAIGWFAADQFAVGGTYALSARTGLYAAMSTLKNKGGGTLSVEDPGSFTFAAVGGSRTLPGGRSTGAEVGIRTIF